ncbi:MAG: hypothetical protein CM15mP49_11370 [Actinomycetota bacterium]|nr:MAG: hypothetical protein CM15mP49_11370 [Actinomycetota bacterium]
MRTRQEALVSYLSRDQWEKSTEEGEAGGVRNSPSNRISSIPEDGMMKKTLPFFKLGLGGKLGSGYKFWSGFLFKMRYGLFLVIDC